MNIGNSKSKFLLAAMVFAGLSMTTPMDAAYADEPTPTRGAYAAYTITGGTADNYNFTTSDGSTTSYYKTNLSVLNLLNNINGSTVWLDGTQGNHNFSVVLPNSETRYFLYAYTKPDGWGDGVRQTYNYNGNAAGNSAFYNNREFYGLDSTVSGAAIYIEGQYAASAGHGSNFVGTMTADFINNSITNLESSDAGLGGALYIWGPYAGIETLNSNFINNHITYSSTKSGGGALAIGKGWNGGESTVGTINGNFINNYIDAPSNNFGGAIYYEGSSYGDGEITSIGQDPLHTTKFEGNHILGSGQGGAIYAINKIGSIYADFIGNYIKGSFDASRGGAISLTKTSDEKTVGSITGDFIGNYITTEANNGTAYGGAIHNNNNVGSITGDFLGNYVVSAQSDTYGGAVNNTGTITTLTSNFIGNYANGKNVYGGAVYNKGTITNLNARFIENDAYSNVQFGYNAVGGAVANKDNGVIENISGDFIRNKAHSSFTSSSMMASGGAIYNEGAKIGTINANFIENEAQREAGAIYNNGDSASNKGIGTVSGNFTNNKVTGEINRDTKGGAISNIGTINSITAANFINNNVNSANGYSSYGGAIYNDGTIGYNETTVNEWTQEEETKLTGGGLLGSTFSGNTATTYGGAIYNAGTINKITADFDSNTSSSEGGAVYNKNVIGIDNGYGFITEGGFIDSSFTNNIATTNGGAIYNGANAKALLISAKTKDVTFSGNKAANGASLYNLSTDGTSITADGGNITFTNNTPTDEAGYGIYTKALINLNAADGYTIKIDDSINVVNEWADIKINDGNFTGTVELNGRINFENANSGLRVGFAGFDSGTLKLGQTPANETYQYFVNSGNYTLDLQNEHAGDNLVLGQLSGVSTMKLNVDYDATANSMDKITVNSGSGTITLNAVNVMNDNPDFVDDTPATYLDGTARNNITVRTDAVQSTVAGMTVYTFTPDLETHGLLTVKRGEAPYEGDLIDAIQDDVGTYHPTAYSMQDNFTADRNFGALNTDNREQFTIFGNNHTISGDNNTYTGIEVANGQTLNIDSVVFSNVKDYDVQNAGTLNLSGTNTINTITGADGVTNITNGKSIFTGNVTQNTVDIATGAQLENRGTITGDVTANITSGTDYSIINKGTMTVNGATFKNTATVTEAMIESDAYTGALTSSGSGTITVKNSLFEGNSAKQTAASYSHYGKSIDGGAMSTEGGTVIIQDTVFKNNFTETADDFIRSYGGAAYLKGTNLTLTGTYEYDSEDPTKIIDSSTKFVNNRAGSKDSDEFGYGGALSTNFSGTDNIIDGVVFKGNLSNFAGGALRTLNNLKTVSAYFDSNSVQSSIGGPFFTESGGAVYNEGTITNLTSTFVNNFVLNDYVQDEYKLPQNYTPVARGGAVYNVSTITNLNSDFIGNYADATYFALGGALDNRGTIDTIESTFKDNYVINHKQGKMYSGDITSYANGGAIYNAGTINLIKDSVFDHNSALTTNEYNKPYGSAIYNTGTITKIQDSTFKNNTSGGVLYNFKTIDTISGGEFSNNEDTAIANVRYGSLINEISGTAFNENNNGAILNSYTEYRDYTPVIIKSINGTFTGNKRTVASYNNLGGGAIQNSVTSGYLSYKNSTVATIGNWDEEQEKFVGTAITGDFENNYVTSADNDAGGGAIANFTSYKAGKAEIGDITGKTEKGFKGNHVIVTGSGHTAMGGAIFNKMDPSTSDDDLGAKIGNITANFTENYVQADDVALGGAIYTVDDTGIIKGNFTGNYATAKDARGGAIAAVLYLNIEDSSFYNNYTSGTTESLGGAVYNEGTTIIKAAADDIVFSGNKANYGAGVYMGNGWGTLALYAKGGDILFENNNRTGAEGGNGTGIHSSGYLVLVAEEGQKITINDKVQVNKNMHINSGLTNLISPVGTVEFTDTIFATGKNSELNLNGGTLKLSANAAKSLNTDLNTSTDTDAFEKFNSSGGTLDIKNDSIDKIKPLSSSGSDISGTIKWLIDIDDTSKTGDKFVSDIVDENIGVGSVIISAINILNDNSEDAKIQVGLGSVSQIMSVANDIIISGGNYDVIGEYDAVGQAYYLNLAVITYDNINSAVIADDKFNKSYSLKNQGESGGETVTGNLGNLVGHSLTVDGKNFFLNGDSKQGFVIGTYEEDETTKPQTLTLKNMTVKNFTTAVNNAGTLNVEDVTFTNNTTDINNTATLNLSGTNTIKTITDAATPTGVTNITGGTTELARYGSITQSEINLKGGRFIVNQDTTVNSELIGDENSHVDYEVSGSSMAGVLNNAGTLLSAISGTFKDNTFTAGQIARGGVIYNGGTINSVTADFTDNTMIAADEGYGGAIYNSGTIKSISGNFTNNTNGKTAEQYTNAHRGGAIYNISNGVIGNKVGEEFVGDAITGTFTGNIAGLGGAIFNGYDYYDPNAEIGNITANFDNNKAMAGQGGAIFNGRKIASISGTYTNNSASNNNEAFGGAIYTSGAITNGINNSTFTGNSVTSTTGNAYGGAIYNAAGTTITSLSGEFKNNTASATASGKNSYGGAIANSATINSINASFENNKAGRGGAIANLQGGTIGVWDGELQSFTGTAITGNFVNNSQSSTAYSGGAIYNYNGKIGNIESVLDPQTSTKIGFKGNSANSGGAISNIAEYHNQAIMGDINADFTNNTSSSYGNGGAINNYTSSGYDDTLAQIGNITGNFTNNTGANYGGAISNYRTNGIAKIGNITGNFDSNTSINYGGAISNFDTNSQIGNISGVFTNNSSRYGGAILNVNGQIGTITNSEFSNNTAQSENSQYIAAAMGGAISSSNGTLGEINNVVFNNNNAIAGYGESKGGAIYLESQANTQLITDSSFTGNKADIGGAIYAKDTNVVISAATKDVEFTNNNSTGTASGTGTGLYFDGGTLTMNADAGHNITINDTVSSTTGMTVNAGGTHAGKVILNGELTLGDSGITVDGGTVQLNADSLASIADSTITLNGGEFSIADGVLEAVSFANPINLTADSGLALDISLGETNQADGIISDVSGASTLYLTNFNFIEDNKNGGEVTIADGNIKGSIALKADVAGGYADVQYNNTTGVLSFADKIDWLQQTNGIDSGYRFTKTDNGIMPVNYKSGDNNYTFYTDILKKNYTDDNGVAHDLKYTWDNSTHLLTVTNSDDTALTTTKATIVVTGDGSSSAPFVYTGDHVGNTAIGLNRWNNFGTITGDFVGNTNGAIAMGMGVQIPAIIGNFIGNTGGSAFSFSGDHSWGSTVTSITGDFIGNYNNNIYNNSGGAIYIFNWNNGGIGTVTGDFIGNKADGLGGAIALTDSHINSVIGNFVNNYAGDAGGALLVGYGKNGANISVTGDFIGNRAVNRGGAVHSGSGANIRLIDTSFIGNIAPEGAALYIDKGELSVTALNKDIEFTNNNSTGLAGGEGYGIYHKSSGYRPFVLSAYDGRTITVNDRVYSEEKISLNNYYTGDWVAKNGTIIFNNEFTQTGLTEISSNEKNAGGGTVIFNGTAVFGDLDMSGDAVLKLGTAAGNTTIGAVTFTRTPVVDVANGTVQELTVASVKGNGNLNFDIDFTGDTITADSLNITTGGKTGVITLNSINALTSETGVIREFSDLAILKGTTENVTLAFSQALLADKRFFGDEVESVTREVNTFADNATFNQFEDNKFSDTVYAHKTQQKLSLDDTKTKLSFGNTETVPEYIKSQIEQDVLQSLNQSESASRSLTTDDATASYTAAVDLGVTGAGVLTVQGATDGTNTATLDMASKSGFTVSNANTTLNLTDLKITNVADTADGGLINLTGENSAANLSGVTIAATTNKAIVNDTTLNLTGTNDLGTGVTGTGATNVNGGKTTVGSLIQNVVNIVSGNLVATTITTADNTVSNGGTLTLVGTSNSNAISGTGKTVIASALTNTGNISQAVEVEETAVLNTDASNLGGTITNAGILNLSGALNKAVSGAGTTKVNSALTLGAAADLSTGTLDLNGGLLTLSGDGVATEYGVNKLANSGHIKVDIDYTGEPVADSINIALADTSAKTITVDDITEIGTASDSFTVQVLKGATDNITLTLDEDLANRYKGDVVTETTEETDAYSANIDFDKKSFDTIIYQETTQKTLSVIDNIKLKLDKVVITPKHETGRTSEDALATLNTHTGSRSMSATTETSSNAYKVAQDLGNTAAGDITVEGRSASDPGTLDMNGKSGFVVANDTATVNIKNMNIINANEADGSLINITNGTSSANLEGVTVAQNGSNVISSNGTLTVKDSAVNAGISNNGTLNFEGTSSADKVVGDNGTTNIKGETTVGSIVQKVVNIVAGGKLIANGDVTTGTGEEEGIVNAVADGLEVNNGTLTGNVSGTGSVKTTGTSAIADGSKVNQDVNVESGTLTTSADSLGGAVTNAGEVALTGGTLEQTITGGNTTVTGNVAVDDTTGAVTGAVAVAAEATLTTNADNVSGAITNSGNVELTGGDIQNTISGDGTTTVSGDVTNTTNSAITSAIAVSEGATLTTSADAIGNDVTNSGNVALTGGTLEQTITGGTTDVTGNVAVDDTAGTIAGAVTVAAEANLKANADNVTGAITNSGNVELTGGDIQNAISGTGKTTVTGDVTNTTNSAITSVIAVNDGASLTASADSIGGAVTNAGEVALTGGTLEQTITGGTTTVSGNVAVDDTAGAIAGAVTVASEANLKANADNVTGAITNSGNVELTGGDIQNAISGTGKTTVTGDVTNTTNSAITSAIAVNEGATLSTGADSIGNDVVNSGTVDLTGGTLSKTIAGGNTTVSGDVAVDDAAGYIDGTVAVTAGSNLKTDADNLNGAITANGQIELTGGELTQNVTGTGTTKIAGDVINSANVQTVTEVASGSLDNANGQLANVVVTDGTLKSDADKVSGTVTNNGTYEVTGGTISNAIAGTGDVTITGNVVNDAVNTTTGNVTVSENATLSLGANSDDMFGSASQIELNDGSVLNINNGNATPTTVNNVNVAADSKASVEMAWGDAVNSASGDIDGSLTITKLDLSQTDGSNVSYAFSNLGTDIAFADDIEIVGTTTSSNFVRYDSTTGQMNSKTNSLQTAVDDTTAGEKSIYMMNGSESGANDTLVGDLTVRGNGAAITGGGIVVGDGITAGADLVLEDVSVNNVNAAQDGALYVNGGNTLEIKAENQNVTIGGTSGSTNAIYLNKDANGNANATIDVAASRTVDISDDIRSNNLGNVLELKGNGDIHLRGILDPLTVNMSAANVYRYNQDQNIDWNINGGVLHYASDSYLSGLGNSINFNGGSLDLMNGAATNISLTNLTVTSPSGIFVDVDATNQKMDTLSATGVYTIGSTLNVAGMNIFGAPVAAEFETLFVDGATLGNGALIGKVTSSVTNVDTGVYKYNVNYVDDGTTGKFKYSVNITPKTYDTYSPAVYGSSVAMQGAYLSQLNNYETAFGNLDQTMLMTQEQRKALKYGNMYASNDETNPQVYSPLYSQNENKGVWFRPYASFERVQLDNGPDVNNVMYGSLVGGDTDIFSIGDKGWEGQVSVYAGYNGSHQTYDGIGIYQNGGLIGATGVLYKGNFFTALTANVGASAADIKTNFGSNDMTMLTTGISSKTGYNWELLGGKLILQPSWTMSYTLVNPFNNYTMGNGVKVENRAVNALQLAPGLKIIGNLPKGWQPYLGVNMRWNIMDNTCVKAGYVGVPETSVKPYIEYGLGVQKMIGERFTGFGQTMFRGGGRSGVSFTFGFRWALGELNDKHQQKSVTPKKSKAKTKAKAETVETVQPVQTVKTYQSSNSQNRKLHKLSSK